MIDYICGKISELGPTRVTVENQGIGYALEISLQTYSLLEGKEDVKIFIQQQVNARDGITIDYGFADKSERELFRMITGVSGMGAASARMILSTFSADELKSAILSEDVNRLKSVKGLGVKSAQRLILELKDKVFKGETGEVLFSQANNAVTEEATGALQMLGFSKPNIQKVVTAILKATPNASVEQIIKSALQML